MDASYVAQNRASQESLRALVARLTEGDLDRSVGHGWTVKAALAHLAYWDRRALANFEEWERSGVKITPVAADPINDGLLPDWLAMPSEQVLSEVVAAAEAVDRKIEGVSAELVEAVMAQRPRTVIRAAHRLAHMEEIERALAG